MDSRDCGLYLHRGLYHRGVAEREEAFVVNSLRPHQGRVLEVGPGTGRITRHLVDLADSLTVCDIDPESLTKVQSRLGPNAEVSCFPLGLERLREIPGYGAFDAAVAVRVVPHAADWRLALNNLVGSVRPGGLILFDLWNRHSFVGALMKLFAPREPSPVHRPTRRGIRDALASLPASVHSAYRWGYPRLGALHLDDLGSFFFPAWAYSALYCLRRHGSGAE